MALEALDNPRVFFEIDINGESAGRIVMELYSHVVPKTVCTSCKLLALWQHKQARAVRSKLEYGFAGVCQYYDAAGGELPCVVHWGAWRWEVRQTPALQGLWLSQDYP